MAYKQKSPFKNKARRKFKKFITSPFKNEEKKKKDNTKEETPKYNAVKNPMRKTIYPHEEEFRKKLGIGDDDDYAFARNMVDKYHKVHPRRKYWQKQLTKSKLVQGKI